MIDPEYIERRARFEYLFLDSFRRGEINVFIVLNYSPAAGGKPMLSLANRPVEGSLPIPAWLSRDKAKKFIQNPKELFQDSKVVEISHADLQAMIDNQQYNPAYHAYSISKYQLALKASPDEVDKFLSQFDD